ncbi:hypothetical protein GGG16DRAFT_98074 [Schizophyllum commune]
MDASRGALSFLAGLVLSSSQTPLVGREDVQLSERAVELDWSVKLVAEETERLRLDVGLLPHTGQPELRVLKPLLGLPIAAPRMLAEEVEGRVRWEF